MTFFYTATALQLPYVLCPGDPGTWLFARSFGILYYPICFTILYHRYFQTDKPWRQWSAVTYFVTPFLLLGGLLFIVFFHQNNLLIPYKLTWEIAMGGVSILLSIHLFKECKWLIKKVDSYHTQNYSNESDFPFAFAKKILHLPALGLLMMWTLFILDNQMVKAYIDLFMAAWQVQFLCRILHPNKMIHSEQNKNNMDFIENENMEQILQEKELFEKIVQTADGQVLEEAPIDDTSDEPKLITYNKEKLRLQMEQENWESVKNEVLTIVSRRYLEPSLNRSGARCQFDEPHSGRHLHHTSGILQTGQRFPHPSLRKADGVRLFCQHRTGSRCRAVRFQEQMGTHQCQKATQRLRLRPDREVCELNFLPFFTRLSLYSTSANRDIKQPYPYGGKNDIKAQYRYKNWLKETKST